MIGYSILFSLPICVSASLINYSFQHLLADVFSLVNRKISDAVTEYHVMNSVYSADTEIKENHRLSFLNTKLYPELFKELEEKQEELEKEFKEIMSKKTPKLFKNQLSGQDVLDKESKWQSLIFKVYGVETKNIEYAPVLREILRKYGHIISLAKYSILNGPTVIQRHKGIFSGFLRVHQSLEIPDECLAKPTEEEINSIEPTAHPTISKIGHYHPLCYIQVESLRRTWKPKDILILDDTLRHNVVFKVNARRSVLFLDIIRPDIPLWAKACIKTLLFITPYVDLIKETVIKAEL